MICPAALTESDHAGADVPNPEKSASQSSPSADCSRSAGTRAFCTRHPFTCRRRAAAALHLTSRAPQQVWTPSRQRWVESVSWTSTPKCANSPRPVTRRSGLRPPRTRAGAVGCYQAAAARVAQLRRLVSPVLPCCRPCLQHVDWNWSTRGYGVLLAVGPTACVLECESAQTDLRLRCTLPFTGDASRTRATTD